MKTLLTSFLLLFATLSWGSSLQGVEDTINTSSVVTGKCEGRICFVYPKDGISSQEFRDEVSFIESHLSLMGLETREDFIWPTTTTGTLKKEKLSHVLLRGETPLTLEELIAQ